MKNILDLIKLSFETYSLMRKYVKFFFTLTFAYDKTMAIETFM